MSNDSSSSVFLETESRGTFHLTITGKTDVMMEQEGQDCSGGLPPPVLFCFHGAGMSGKSFLSCGQLLSDDQGSGHVVRTCSMDLRCHGQTPRRPISLDLESSLSLDVLVSDAVVVVTTAMKKLYHRTPKCYLVGHSLGGAIAASAVHKLEEGGKSGSLVSGLILIDIVEGTAKMSLQYMKAFLEKRPTTFKTSQQAVQWFLAHGGMHNAESAKVSVPSLLHVRSRNVLSAPSSSCGVTCDDHKSIDGDRGAEDPLVWITNLEATLPQWETWFEDLDKNFISAPCPKMLCLAGTDRLDKDMTVAQMQGKFQMEVFGAGLSGTTVGHYIMEDDPDAFATKVRRFTSRIETLTRALMKSKPNPM